MKVVLCNGDSLGMPRENVKFESTWYYKLSNELLHSGFYFVNNFKRANTTNFLNHGDALEYYSPNIVIVQLGIVDCAPRVYKTNGILLKVVNKLPNRYQKLFWAISKKFRKRSLKRADVNINTFEDNLVDFLNRCAGLNIEKCIIIKIAFPGSDLILNSPKIKDAITLYNSVFDKIESNFQFVKVVNPLSEGNDDDYIQDGYHLNEVGNLKVFNSLLSELQA